MVKVKTTSIKASSRQSIKLGDSFFTVEYIEERSVEISDGQKQDKVKDELTKAKDELWDDVNNEVDKQIDDIIDAYRARRNR